MFIPIEPLEDRIAPAGVVNFTYNAASGALTLAAADGEAHEIFVGKGANNVYVVDGTPSGTEIGDAGDTIQFITGPLNALTITGGADTDDVRLDNLAGLKTVSFTGGAGLDTVSASNLGVKGAVQIDFGGDGGNFSFEGLTATVGGDVTVNYGDGGFVDFNASKNAVGGAVTLTGGAGQDSFLLSGEITSVGKGVKFTGNGEADTIVLRSYLGVSMGKAADGNAINFDAGAGENLLEFTGGATKLKGNVKFLAGNDSNSVKADVPLLQVDGTLSVTTGSDDDDVTWSPSTLKVGKAATFDLGAGLNVFDSKSLSSTYSGALTIKGGANIDNFRFGGGALAVNGAVDINLGAQDNTMLFQSTRTTLGGTLRVTGGAGEDTFQAFGSTFAVKKAVILETGDGDSLLEFNPGTLTLGSSFSATGGINVDEVQIRALRASLAGAVTIESKAGDDNFGLFARVLEAKGAITFNGGGDADTAAIFADGAITGNVAVDLGAGDNGDQLFELASSSGLLGSLKLGGKLTVTATTTDSTTTGFTDTFRTHDVSVAKAVSVSLGVVDSKVEMNNFSTQSTVDVQTGAGADQVAIEQASYFGPATMKGLVTVQLGAGDDTIAIGISSAAKSNDFVRFLGGLTVDGGANDDTGNDFLDPGTNFFAPKVKKTKTSIEN